MDIHKFQDMLDDNKTEIPDNIYMKLSNMCLQKYKEEEKDVNFYEVIYLYQIPLHRIESIYTMNTRVSTEILKLKKNVAVKIQKSLDEKGYCSNITYCYHHEEGPELVSYSEAFKSLANDGKMIQIHIENNCEGCGDSELVNVNIEKEGIIIKLKKLEN